MYLEYWGLKKFPFENVPDPNFMYYSPEHEEALARFLYVVKENKGMVMLTGEIGSGKTTLSRVLIQQLSDIKFDVAIDDKSNSRAHGFFKRDSVQSGC